MVQWSNGPMVQWSNCPMVQWSKCPMVQWFNGPIQYFAYLVAECQFGWSNGPMDQWSNGPMVQWFNVIFCLFGCRMSIWMVQWSNGPMVQRSNGPMAQWSNGTMVQWCILGHRQRHNIAMYNHLESDSNGFTHPFYARLFPNRCTLGHRGRHRIVMYSYLESDLNGFTHPLHARLFPKRCPRAVAFHTRHCHFLFLVLYARQTRSNKASQNLRNSIKGHSGDLAPSLFIFAIATSFSLCSMQGKRAQTTLRKIFATFL